MVLAARVYLCRDDEDMAMAKRACRANGTPVYDYSIDLPPEIAYKTGDNLEVLHQLIYSTCFSANTAPALKVLDSDMASQFR